LGDFQQSLQQSCRGALADFNAWLGRKKNQTLPWTFPPFPNELSSRERKTVRNVFSGGNVFDILKKFPKE